MKKSGLSFEEHGNTGDELQQYRDSVLKIASLLSGKYPKNSGLYELAKKAADNLDTLRFKLADYAHEEHFKTEGVNGLDLYQRSNLKK